MMHLGSHAIAELRYIYALCIIVGRYTNINYKQKKTQIGLIGCLVTMSSLRYDGVWSLSAL